MSAHLSLSEYARRIAQERRLSCYEVSRRSGGKISKSTVNNLLAGRCGGITIEKLQALAQGLGVSADEILKIAIEARDEKTGEPSTSRFADLHYKFGKLVQEDANVILTLIDVIEHEIERLLNKRFMIESESAQSNTEA
jgi:transcriptional regulator with XRE-family HTH domain